MDSREAREILGSYRPGDTNKVDQRMAEALDLARHDPELAAWFGQHCAEHAAAPAISAEKPRPATLPDKPPAPDAATEFIVPVSKAVALGIVAVMLIIGGLAWWSYLTPKPQNTFERYRDRMARLVQRNYPMKMLATDQAQIREFLRTNSGPAALELPGKLEKLPGVGGAVLTWHSQPVSMLALDGGANTCLYLFLINRSVLTDPPISERPQFTRVGRLMTAGWTKDDKVFLLAGPNDEAVMRGYVE